MKEFFTFLDEMAEKFNSLPSSYSIKLVSNLDADGISAGAIMIKALQRAGRKHSVSIIHQLREQELMEYAEEDCDLYIFADLGSGVLSLIEKHLGDKQVLVLDHHHPHGKAKNVWHINPHLFGINGSEDVSASGVCFFFARATDKRNEDMAHIAIVGAIGDVQENNGFHGLNKIILDIAVEKGVLKVSKNLNLFGMQSRPIHKLLEYGSDLKIPGVTNSESGSVHFLQSLGIDPQVGGRWKLIGELTEDEKKKLIAGIIVKRADHTNPEDIFANSYRIPMNKGSFSDAREFATLLNACGRLEKASAGLSACLGEKGFERRALAVHKEYKKEIVRAMNWFRDNKNSDKIIRGKNYVIINAENNVLNTMIGTIASIISKSNNYPSGTFFLSMARKPDKVTKVSIRIVDNPEDLNLRDIIADIASRVDGEAGGHQFAAGAIISTDKEKEFVKAAIEVFERL